MNWTSVARAGLVAVILAASVGPVDLVVRARVASIDAKLKALQDAVAVRNDGDKGLRSDVRALENSVRALTGEIGYLAGRTDRKRKK